ncbi:hypothetical protein ACIBL8_21295 [Streptomyces sp. NPDC050523]|uniref:hypothetical protein n=1 Tax=Streptomyces sp. NPDC050523 TaxID=3365622 RepID=UPI0037BC598E
MLHRARPRASVLRHARGDIGATSVETLLVTVSGLTFGAALCFLAVRGKAKFDAFVAGRPAPPFLPEVTIPWGTIGIAAGAIACGVAITVVVLAQRAVSRERQAERRRRVVLEARHDRVLEDLGAHLVEDPAGRALDELELLEALTEAQGARIGDDDHHYRTALRTLEAQWKATAADRAPTHTA